MSQKPVPHSAKPAGAVVPIRPKFSKGMLALEDLLDLFL